MVLAKPRHCLKPVRREKHAHFSILVVAHFAVCREQFGFDNDAKIVWHIKIVTEFQQCAHRRDIANYAMDRRRVSKPDLCGYSNGFARYATAIGKGGFRNRRALVTHLNELSGKPNVRPL